MQLAQDVLEIESIRTLHNTTREQRQRDVLHRVVDVVIVVDYVPFHIIGMGDDVKRNPDRQTRCVVRSSDKRCEMNVGACLSTHSRCCSCIGTYGPMTHSPDSDSGNPKAAW